MLENNSNQEIYLPNIGEKCLVYENRYQQIYSVTADFGNFSKEYFVSDTGQRAGMVAIHNGNVLMVRQYRLLINSLSLEIPGGKVDPGETPEAAAVRECFEETGIRCSDAKHLIFYHPGLDTRHNPTYLFYSHNTSQISEEHEVHPGEITSFEWVDFNSCLDMISNGQIVDSFTIIGLLSYQSLTAQ